MPEGTEREQALYEALRAAGDPQAIVSLVRSEPELLSDTFVERLAGWIAAAEAEGNAAAARGLTQRRAVLLELRNRHAREADLPPISRALMAFLRADDEAAARQVYEDRRELLDGEEAQQALEHSFKSDDPAGQARIAERAALLSRLRDA